MQSTCSLLDFAWFDTIAFENELIEQFVIYEVILLDTQCNNKENSEIFVELQIYLVTRYCL